MGKENTRTLKNSYNNKKSKKNSKKNSKKGGDTTEEMMNILNSDTEVVVNKFGNKAVNNSANKGLIQYDGDLPEQYQNQMISQMNNPQMNPQMMGQMMGQPQMGQPQFANPQYQQMLSPSNYDPLMLQQMAPVQNAQSFQSMGMPADVKAMPDVSRLANLSSNSGQPGQPAIDSGRMAQMLGQFGGSSSVIRNLAQLAKSSMRRSRPLVF